MLENSLLLAAFLESSCVIFPNGHCLQVKTRLSELYQIALKRLILYHFFLCKSLGITFSNFFQHFSGFLSWLYGKNLDMRIASKNK